MVMMARAYESIYDLFADPNMFEILMDPIKYNKLIRSLPQTRISDLSWMFEDRQYAFKNACDFQKFLIARGVKPDDIKEGFRNANLEDGLYAFGEPELDISIVDRTPNNINVDNGKTINLTCRLRAFPKPEFSLNFKGQSLTVQVKYDSINGCFECTFEKNTAREIDSGPYALTMKQTKRNRDVSEVVLHFSVNVGRDFVTKEFYVRVDPMECAVNPGNEINLKANVNCEDPSQFTYEWHFMDLAKTESKVENADTESLVIKNCSIEDMGTYRCLVQHKASGKKKWSENRAKVNLNEISEFELKIMLIIGNADYVTSDCPSGECHEKYKDIGSMDIYASLAKIRHEMEQLGFLTMSFLNLNPQEYKRSLALFRRLCEPAHRVYVLVYVAGHGHNYIGKDYLIPTDSQRHYHFSGHRNYLRDSMSLSLNYLMECFVSTVAVPVVEEPPIDGTYSSGPKNNAVDTAVSETTHLITNNDKFTVGIFWDLCRSNVKTYADFQIKKDVFDYPYMILFSCNVGRQGYYLDQEFDDQNFKLEKGSIFSNLFLKNLNKSLGIYEIGVRMNDDIKLLQKDNTFHLLNKIMIEGQALHMKIGLVASSNKEYEKQLSQFYIEKNQKNLISSDKKKIVSYYFDKDEFINTVLLVVETKLTISLNYDSRLQIKAIDENQDGKKIYRIFNILRCDIQPHQTPILMTVHDWVPNYEVDENGETGRLAWQFELDFQHVAEHFQRLSAIMVEPLPKAGAQESTSSEEDSDLHTYDRPNSIDSEYSISSASLTTSAERTVEDSFESSSIASSDDY